MLTSPEGPFTTSVLRYSDAEATVLVSSDWQGPSIVGYTGMLDRIRFAVDPPANQFHFGPLV